MSEARTERLVDELSRGLGPVRRLPRLRVVGATVAALAMAAAGAALWLRGTRSNLLELVAGDPGFTAIALGLALAALGGALASLGAAVPGRDRVERLGLALLAAGVVSGAIVGPLALAASAGAADAAPLRSDLDCLIGAARVAAIPVLALLWFQTRAFAHRLLLAVGLTIAGAFALGGLVMQASCPFAGARHLIVGHALAPVLGALLLVLPLGWLIRRRRDRF